MTTKNAPFGTFRVFVASPSDVLIERDSLSGVINELNRTITALLPKSNIRLDLVRWESHAFPSMGRPQQVINDQIGDYDIFVGILWKRFGSPTGKADSGTKEEFHLAYENWKNHGKPHILFYFNKAHFPLPSTLKDVEQMANVVKFREQLESQGLVWEYADAQQFAAVVRPHLTEVIGKLLSASQDVGLSAANVEKVPARKNRTQNSPVGARIQITAIGKGDAFYDIRKEFIGLGGTLIEAEQDGRWYFGRVKLDKTLAPIDDGIYPFAEFKYKLLTTET